MTEFGVLHPDGTYEVRGSLPQSAMLACPHRIIALEHYRPDHSCRCDDPEHTDMAEWGYTFDGTAWVVDDERDE